MTAQRLSIEQILLKKWGADELSHFYIFESNAGSLDSESLATWTSELLKKIILNDCSDQSLEGLDIFNHADILWIGEPETQKYSVQDERFNEMLSANESKPRSLKKKIIVLERTDLLTEILANKLLKTLEDASSNNLFIFLNPYSKKIIQTIRSRSIALTINLDKNNKSRSLSTETSFTKWFEDIKNTELTNERQEKLLEAATLLNSFFTNEISLFETLESIKQRDLNELDIFNVISSWMTNSTSNYKECENSINSLKWWEKQKTFNNQLNSRVQNLLINAFNINNA